MCSLIKWFRAAHLSKFNIFLNGRDSRVMPRIDKKCVMNSVSRVNSFSYKWTDVLMGKVTFMQTKRLGWWIKPGSSLFAPLKSHSVGTHYGVNPTWNWVERTDRTVVSTHNGKSLPCALIMFINNGLWCFLPKYSTYYF